LVESHSTGGPALSLAEAAPLHDASDRVLLAIDTAVEVMLEEPGVNRAVMGWLGTAGPTPGEVLAHSSTLWALALGDGEGLFEPLREEALRCLPEQLAFAFRGVLSFWTAGELADEALSSSARKIAASLLSGFSPGCHSPPRVRNRPAAFGAEHEL
jgi:hypothetical protein